jgi:hypothetical protein
MPCRYLVVETDTGLRACAKLCARARPAAAAAVGRGGNNTGNILI